jgi:hypothetical protein
MLAFVGLAGVAGADTKGDSGDTMAMRITVDGVQGEALKRSRGLVAILVAYYAKVPGLALLEGDPVATQARQTEIELSRQGLVDEDSRVVDRTMKADVTVTLRGLTHDATTKRTEVRVVAEGPSGRREKALAFTSFDEVGFLVDDVVRGVVASKWSPAFEGDCSTGDPRAALLMRASCVPSIVRACASGLPKDRLTCLAVRGQEIHRWAKRAAKKPEEHVPMPASLAEALAQVKGREQPGPEVMAQWQAYGARVQAFQNGIKEAMETFRPRLLAAMEDVINGQQINLSVGDDTPLKFMTVAGVRWNRLDNGPLTLFDLKAEPGSRRVTRVVFGEEQVVTEDVRSFGLRGRGEGGGTVFEYRLLCIGTGPTDCNVQTSLPGEYFQQVRSVQWYEPDWRMRR